MIHSVIKCGYIFTAWIKKIHFCYSFNKLSTQVYYQNHTAYFIIKLRNFSLFPFFVPSSRLVFYIHSLFFSLFFNSLTFNQILRCCEATLGSWLREQPHSPDIHCNSKFDPRVVRSYVVVKLVFWAQSSAQWGLNQQHSDVVKPYWNKKVGKARKICPFPARHPILWCGK